jgi:hypothetical protein
MVIAWSAWPALRSNAGNDRVPFPQGDVHLNRQSVEPALALSPRHSPRRPNIQCRLPRFLPYRLLAHQHHPRPVSL